MDEKKKKNMDANMVAFSSWGALMNSSFVGNLKSLDDKPDLRRTP
jgi:hypothetical protein